MSAVADEALVVTEPGVYRMTDLEYFADPVPGGSLSCSGAKKLMPPYCPAIYAWEREHGRPEKHAFDFGKAAHRLVLGKGAELVIVEADDWRTKAAQTAKKDAYAAGKTPLLEADYEVVKDMAAALWAHPTAAALLAPDRGETEVAMFWIDKRYDVWRRLKLDYLPNRQPGKRLIIPDYKTAESADPEKFSRAAANYGYERQAAWYSDGPVALGMAEQDEVAFVFVVQEHRAPYLVNTIALDETAMNIGRLRNAAALGRFSECQRTNTWPGYGPGIEYVALPRWAEAEFSLEELSA